MSNAHLSRLTILVVPLFFTAVSASASQLVQQGGKLVGTGNIGPSAEGVAVAISADGNTILVGGEHDNGDIGAAWVFTRTAGVWTQQAELVGTGNVGTCNQGQSVALSSDGNTALLGGGGDNSNFGAAWVFTRSAGVWTQQGAKLVVTGNAGNAGVSSVALSGDGNTALIGGQGDNASVGAVWVFTRSAGVWTQQGAKLVGTGYVGGPAEGHAVSLSGDGNTALIGGVYDAGQNGAFWIFTRSGGVWTQQGGKMVATGNIGAARQGGAVSLSADGNTALVSGYADNGNIGAAWIFTNSGGVWTQQGNKFVGTGNVGTAGQGGSAALSGDGSTVLLGGGGDNGGIGAGWVFTRSGGVVTQQGAKLVGTGYSGTPGQGNAAISSDGSTAVLGGDNDSSNVGAVWVFTASLPLSFASAPNALPATAGTGQSVSFSAAATGGVGTLAYSWNFGDGSSAASGMNVTYAYAAAGAYTATLTVTDATAATVSGTVTVTVNAPAVGTGNDSDGDGYSDAFEAAFENQSDPTTTLPPLSSTTIKTLTGAKLSAKLNFAKQNSDSLTLSGTLAIPAAFKVSGAKLGLAVGGLVKVFTLDDKGKAKSGGDQVSVSIKSSQGTVAAQASKFSIKLNKDSLTTVLAAFGLTNDNATSKSVIIPFSIVFANSINQDNVTLHYAAKKGKSGSAK